MNQATVQAVQNQSQSRWTAAESKQRKIIAKGNVVVENPDGNKSYSDNIIYLAEDGRIILGGDTEALYFSGNADAVSGKGVI